MTVPGRRFAHLDTIKEDKRETKKELERLEISDKDGEDGSQNSQSKLVNAMTKGW
jgi:hypothetical protein